MSMKKVTTQAESCLELFILGCCRGGCQTENQDQVGKKGWLKIKRQNEAIKPKVKG